MNKETFSIFGGATIDIRMDNSNNELVSLPAQAVPNEVEGTAEMMKSGYIQNPEKIALLDNKPFPSLMDKISLLSEKWKLTADELNQKMLDGKDLFGSEINMEESTGSIQYWLENALGEQPDMDLSIAGPKGIPYEISTKNAENFAQKHPSQATEDEKVSALVMTAAKLEAVRPMMGDVFPALEMEAIDKARDEMRVLLTEISNGNEDAKAKLDFIVSRTQNRVGGKALRTMAMVSMMAVLITACAGVARAGTKEPETVVPPTRIVEVATATPTEIPPTPTEIVVPTVVVEPTAEPTAVPTEIVVSETEAKDYGVCTIEKFRDCPIPVEDLFNGEYLKFLRTLSKPFDPSKFKDPMPRYVKSSDFGIIPNPATAPNFPNPEEAPFRKDVTYGVTQLENGRMYLVMAIEYSNPKSPSDASQNVFLIMTKNLFSIAVKSEGRPLTEGEINRIISAWKQMNVVPIKTNYINPNSGISDKLLAKTFTKYSDIQQRFSKFMAGDPASLDGLVLGTTAVPDYPDFK